MHVTSVSPGSPTMHMSAPNEIALASLPFPKKKHSSIKFPKTISLFLFNATGTSYLKNTFDNTFAYTSPFSIGASSPFGRQP